MEAAPLTKVEKDILFLLARRMQQGSTLIPAQHSPSLNRIARASAWSKRHIQRGLNMLEQRGLLIRHRPSKHDAQARGARTNYTVVYERLHELGTQRLKEARDTPSIPLETARPKAGDKVSRELGTGSRGARDAVSHSQTLSEPSDQADPEIVLIQGLLRVRTGVLVSEESAAETRRVLLARPDAGKAPSAYIRRVLTTDPQPQRWLPATAPPENTQEETC